MGDSALLLWGLSAQLATTGGDAGFGMALYGSGTTFFTLGTEAWSVTHDEVDGT